MSTNQSTIETILELAKQKIESELDLSNIDSGTKFENYVTLVIEEISNNYGISVIQTGVQSFPDIVIGETFGIEVKYTKSEKWESTGNSIFEGTLRKEVTDQIYTFFGRKVGKKIEVIHRYYEDCLADIKVTHSPRFFLNMEVGSGESILHKIGITYGEFKAMNSLEKSKVLKDYVRSTLGEGESLWWLDEEESVSPRVKEFRKLQEYKKQNIIAEGMALFPEVFSNSSTKYLNLSVYLLQEYQIVSSSLRDAFSAGGKANIEVCGEPQIIPKVYGKLYVNAKKIEKILSEIELDKLQEYWKGQGADVIVNEENKIKVWQELIDNLAVGLPEGLNASDIFKAGLEE
ncbi:hypothetical protein GPA07_07120 [Bacillus sp. ms-22]|uniref:hypothetical protein n=1 Tax=Bacillus sp. ms-22 TaxID=2683680 RepID=UPI0012F9889F|nr:hypothetical protein [Bacillus sp. ms-22]QGX65211.1 hypothetical protein GPA07_07120 [Bacillus sp. ms-22]